MDEIQFGRLKYSREKERDWMINKINRNVSTIQVVICEGFTHDFRFSISSLHVTPKPMEIAINAIGRVENCEKKQKTILRNEMKSNEKMTRENLIIKLNRNQFGRLDSNEYKYARTRTKKGKLFPRRLPFYYYFCFYPLECANGRPQ